jgi:putative DNA primase/helicase
VAKYGHVSAVAAFDSGNLLAVATALHERWPGKPIMITGDDDHRLEHNPGRAKAVEAAAAVKGLAVFPQFDAQQRERGLTDFNDLALENRPLAGQQLEEAVSRARTCQIENELERVREQSMEVGTQV